MIRLKTRSKYAAVKTTIDGITFASKKEAKRYAELKLLERAGEIKDLKVQPTFELSVPWHAGSQNAVIGTYVADFQYIRVSLGGQTTLHRHNGWRKDVQLGRHGEAVIEDVKGFKTPLYRWKKKHVEAQYGVTIREV